MHIFVKSQFHTAALLASFVNTVAVEEEIENRAEKERENYARGRKT